MQTTTGKRIAKARKALGMSQTALAEAMGVSQAVISCWERNDPEPHIRVLRKLAPICEVTVADLTDLAEPV